MMPARHHSEYLTAICPLTESTIKKTIYSNAGSSLEWPGLVRYALQYHACMLSGVNSLINKPLNINWLLH